MVDSKICEHLLS